MPVLSSQALPNLTSQLTTKCELLNIRLFFCFLMMSILTHHCYIFISFLPQTNFQKIQTCSVEFIFHRLFLDGFLFSHLQCSLQLHMFISYGVAFFGTQNAFHLTYSFVVLPWWFFSESKLLKKPFNFSFLLCFPTVKNIFVCMFCLILDKCISSKEKRNSISYFEMLELLCVKFA